MVRRALPWLQLPSRQRCGLSSRHHLTASRITRQCGRPPSRQRYERPTMAGINTLLVREWLATFGITSGAVTHERAYRENAEALGLTLALAGRLAWVLGSSWTETPCMADQ